MSECPVCGKQCYQESSGEVETASDGSCVQVTPDEGYCSACGFQYSQHYKHSREEQAEQRRAFVATAETPLNQAISRKMLELDRDHWRARAEAAEKQVERLRQGIREAMNDIDALGVQVVCETKGLGERMAQLAAAVARLTQERDARKADAERLAGAGEDAAEAYALKMVMLGDDYDRSLGRLAEKFDEARARLTQERDAWKADAERLAGVLRECKALFGKVAKALRSDGPLPMDALISEALQMGADTEWASLTAHDALKSEGEPEAAEGKDASDDVS